MRNNLNEIRYAAKLYTEYSEKQSIYTITFFVDCCIVSFRTLKWDLLLVQNRSAMNKRNNFDSFPEVFWSFVRSLGNLNVSEMKKTNNERPDNMHKCDWMKK